jgi:hypothetical protein
MLGYRNPRSSNDGQNYMAAIARMMPTLSQETGEVLHLIYAREYVIAASKLKVLCRCITTLATH